MSKFDSRTELLKIIRKYLDGKATADEERFLKAYYAFFENGENILDQLQQEEKLLIEEQLKAGIWTIVEEHEKRNIATRRLFPYKIAAAAAVLIVLAMGSYWLLRKPIPAGNSITAQTDILPGGNKAVLTLTGGKTVILTGSPNGTLAAQGHGTTINKTANGQLTYKSNSKKETELLYNTLTTPNGGQYKLTLADGSTAWLDAASSIKYPVAFIGGQRHVEITGQVYFEVVHNAAQPFTVGIKGLTIQDVGTRFNINAYNDEDAIKTTLLQGSVKLFAAAAPEPVMVYPGQQAQLQNGRFKLIKADTEGVMAWTNGQFIFNDEPIQSIMKRIARWYNVDVTYQGAITTEGFNGIVSRDKNISQVVLALEKTKGVHIKIEGRRLIVTQ